MPGQLEYGEEKPNKAEVVYDNVPDSIVPPALITIYVLATLALEASGYKTNPALFFTVPIILSILFLGRQNLNAILDIFGFSLRTQFAKTMAVVGIIFGAGIGYLLAYWAINKQASLIALYPFAFVNTADIASRSTALLSLSPGVQIVIFFFVAFGEEMFCVFFFKCFANWLYPAISNRVNLEVFATLFSRVMWAGMHWFAYNGLGQPILYLSAIFLGIIFTACGWTFGFITERIGLGQLTSEKRNFNIPFMIYPAIAAHLVFDIALVVWLAA